MRIVFAFILAILFSFPFAVEGASISGPSLPPSLHIQTVGGINTAHCVARNRECRKALLLLINERRAAVGDRSLSLSATLTYGTPGCIGAQGHSKHEAEMQQASHDQFPADLCAPLVVGGENVGADSGTTYGALSTLFDLMMAEPWEPGCVDNHRCILLDPRFTRIGIGLARGDGVLYLTETFA